MNLAQFKEWGEIVVIGFAILGGLLGIAYHLYRLRLEIADARAALHKDERDRLAAVLRAEREEFERERDELKKSINDLKSEGQGTELEDGRKLQMLLTRLEEITSNIGSLDRSFRLVKSMGGSVRYQNDKAAIQETVKLVYKELSESGQVSRPDMRKTLIDIVYRRLHHGILIRRSGEIDELIDDALNTIVQSSQ